MTEYFPTDDYALRTEENSGESLSKALSANLSNLTSVRRGKNSFFAMTDFSFDNNSSLSRNSTSQRIDDDETRTLLNNDSDNRNIRFSTRLSYRFALSKRSSLALSVNGDYGTQDQDGWQIDTAASVQGLQVKLATAAGTVSKHRSITATRSGRISGSRPPTPSSAATTARKCCPWIFSTIRRERWTP